MSQLRIVATSDIHLGSYHTAVDANGKNMGLKSIEGVLDFITEYCRSVEPDVFIFAGDLYKTSVGKPSQGEQLTAAEFFHGISGICPIIALCGNHDQEAYSGVDALQIFKKMNLRMNVIGRPDEWSVVTFGGVRIGLYHGMLSNSRLESGMISDSVRSGLPSIHDAPSADLHICGDIHKRQRLADNAYYCGAPDRLNWGEEDELPTIWDITVTKDDHGKVVDIQWNAIPTPARRFVTINDEADVDIVDVKGAMVRFDGELAKFTQGELVQLLKSRGAIEVSSVSDSSEFEEAPTIYTSFVPSEAFTIWLEAQPDVTKDLKAYSQELLKELTA